MSFRNKDSLKDEDDLKKNWGEAWPSDICLTIFISKLFQMYPAGRATAEDDTADDIIEEDRADADKVGKDNTSVSSIYGEFLPRLPDGPIWS